MVVLAEKMRAKLLSAPNTQSNAIDEEEFGSKQDMQDWMLSVGIVSPVTKETAGAQYHQQLSRQVPLSCCANQHAALLYWSVTNSRQLEIEVFDMNLGMFFCIYIDWIHLPLFAYRLGLIHGPRFCILIDLIHVLFCILVAFFYKYQEREHIYTMTVMSF